MNGNLIVCPNTNQTSAIKPTQMAATIPRSETLLRISQSGIAQWRAALVKIDILHDLTRELRFSLALRQVEGAPRSFDRAFELAGAPSTWRRAREKRSSRV